MGKRGGMRSALAAGCTYRGPNDQVALATLLQLAAITASTGNIIITSYMVTGIQHVSSRQQLLVNSRRTATGKH